MFILNILISIFSFACLIFYITVVGMIIEQIIEEKENNK